MEVELISLERLRPHPRNSNVMPEAYLRKLAGHLEDTDRYPPVIVRPFDGEYQIIDGHHRVEALRRIGRDQARCVVWDVDDAEALLLLATLNRLQGQDDPRKRAALVGELNVRTDLKELAERLPENGDRLRKLLRINDAMPTPRPPRPLGDMPVAIHFFMLPEQRQAIERRLREVIRDGGSASREEALLSLLGIA
ncbi:MAG: ParB/RepB/Spo0J family partition protein [Planctomycetota bacterium]